MTSGLHRRRGATHPGRGTTPVPSGGPAAPPGALDRRGRRAGALALFVYGAATNKNFHWDTYGKYLFDQRISTGALGHARS